jgi:hypothetical protein
VIHGFFDLEVIEPQVRRGAVIVVKEALLRAAHDRDEKRKPVKVTREQVVEACAEYDNVYPKNDYRDRGHQPWLKEDIDRVGAYEWAMWHDGRCYPPKHILRRATGYEVFHGGYGAGNANEVLDQLGFKLTPRPRLGRDWSDYRREDKHQ